MPEQLVITSHRPLAGQELLRYFVERNYRVRACSPSSAWPAAEGGQLNRELINRHPASLTCCMIDQPRIETLVQVLHTLEPAAIIHAPLWGLPVSAFPLAAYESVVTGTLHWLEAARQVYPRVPFIYLSSTQVYGDRSDTIIRDETETRFDFKDPAYLKGLTEAFPIEGSTHSLWGAAAVAADVLVQEYARSHHLPTCCLRIDSLCDPGNGTEDRRDLLSLIAHACLTGTEYLISKQVREIVSARDVAVLIEAFIRNPRPGEIYNVGGGKSETCSVLEAGQWIEELTGKSLPRKHSALPPLGEPCCHYSDGRHLHEHFPQWKVTESWKKLAQRVVETQRNRLAI